jgi:hypothetical protein
VTADRRPKITGPLGHEGAPSGAPQPVRMRLLGSFSVSVGDRTVARGQWRLRKAVALVKLLAPGSWPPPPPRAGDGPLAAGTGHKSRLLVRTMTTAYCRQNDFLPKM